jgi:hypothetical protein
MTLRCRAPPQEPGLPRSVAGHHLDIRGSERGIDEGVAVWGATKSVPE